MIGGVTNPNHLGKEGVDHINISKDSNITLGIVLDRDFRSAFVYPGLGEFASVTNLSYWLRYGHIKPWTRNCEVSRLRKFRFSGISSRNVKNLQAILAYGTFFKLKKHHRSLVDFMCLDENLEIASYKLVSGSKLRLDSFKAKFIAYELSCLKSQIDIADIESFRLNWQGKVSECFFCEDLPLEKT